MEQVVWEVGEEVAYEGPYAKGPTSVQKIEKIYKTGHILVRGIRYRPRGTSAIQTGDGYSKSIIRKLTPEARATIAKHKRLVTVIEFGNWLCSNADKISDELLSALVAERKRLGSDG